MRGRHPNSGTVHLAALEGKDRVAVHGSHVILSEVPDDTPLSCERCRRALAKEKGEPAPRSRRERVRVQPLTVTRSVPMRTPPKKREEYRHCQQCDVLRERADLVRVHHGSFFICNTTRVTCREQG